MAQRFAEVRDELNCGRSGVNHGTMFTSEVSAKQWLLRLEMWAANLRADLVADTVLAPGRAREL